MTGPPELHCVLFCIFGDDIAFIIFRNVYAQLLRRFFFLCRLQIILLSTSALRISFTRVFFPAQPKPAPFFQCSRFSFFVFFSSEFLILFTIFFCFICSLCRFYARFVFNPNNRCLLYISFHIIHGFSVQVKPRKAKERDWRKKISGYTENKN